MERKNFFELLRALMTVHPELLIALLNAIGNDTPFIYWEIGPNLATVANNLLIAVFAIVISVIIASHKSIGNILLQVPRKYFQERHREKPPERLQASKRHIKKKRRRNKRRKK